MSNGTKVLCDLLSCCLVTLNSSLLPKGTKLFTGVPQTTLGKKKGIKRWCAFFREHFEAFSLG